MNQFTTKLPILAAGILSLGQPNKDTALLQDLLPADSRLEYVAFVREAKDLVNASRGTEHRNSRIEKGLNTFKKDIETLYKKNGTADFHIESAVRESYEAIAELCSNLSKDFNYQDFFSLSPADLTAEANKILLKHDYIISDLFFSANKIDEKEAVASITLERIITKGEIRTEDIDFSLCGAKKNPFDSSILLLEGRTVVKAAIANRPLAPALCIGLDAKLKDKLILLSHDRITQYVSDYNPDEPQNLSPVLRKIMLDYALGRMTFQVSGINGENNFPFTLNFRKKPIYLTNTFGINFALSRNTSINPQLAAIIYNMLNVGIETPENAHLATLNKEIRENIAKTYPKFSNLEQANDITKFMENNTEVPELYLDVLTGTVQESINGLTEALRKIRARQEEMRKLKDTF